MKYVANDGTVFETEAEAVKHEELIEHVEQSEPVIQEFVKTLEDATERHQNTVAGYVRRYLIWQAQRG